MSASSSERLCPLPPKTDWNGKWIWLPESEAHSWRNSYAFFRKRFEAEGNPKIEIAADTRCEFYIDGTRIDRSTHRLERRTGASAAALYAWGEADGLGLIEGQDHPAPWFAQVSGRIGHNATRRVEDSLAEKRTESGSACGCAGRDDDRVNLYLASTRFS